MSNDQPMSRDRQLAIRLMIRCGWEHRRIEGAHQFRKPVEADFWGCPTLRVAHKKLSMSWALNACEHPDLHRHIQEARMNWLRQFMPEAVETQEEAVRGL